MTGSRQLVILGAGGHARVLVEALRLKGVPIAGIVAPNAGGALPPLMGVPLIGDDASISSFDPAAVLLVNGLGSVGDASARRLLFEKFKGDGFDFATVVHPAAVVASDVVLGEGVQVMAGAVIQPGATIGANSIINTRASIDHDCRIGEHIHVAPGATLSGGVTAGRNVHIGTGATVIQMVRIGENAVVAAGAVVIRDVPPHTTVMGVPARERI